MQPPAIACPLTAATIGFGHANSDSNAAFITGRNARTYGAPPATSRGRSTPAENIFPCPVITSAPADDCRYAATCACSASQNSRSMALALPCVIWSTATRPRCVRSNTSSPRGSGALEGAHVLKVLQHDRGLLRIRIDLRDRMIDRLHDRTGDLVG